MKNLFAIGVLLLSSMLLYGQPGERSQRVIDSAKSQHPVKHLGWYISPGILHTRMRSAEVDMPGMSVAVIFNHKFALGLRANAMNDIKKIEGVFSAGDAYMFSGYGGAFFQPIIQPEKRFHVAFPVCIGLGAAGYFEKTGNEENDSSVHGNLRLKDQDVFMVFEPGFECEVNAFTWMRISAGISYRFTGGLNIQNSGEHAFEGLTGSVRIKFGQF